MTDTRPDVPNLVKRQLRQEAGFGCCRCGHPFIQYHHIIPWAEDQHFRPDDMMVLCGQCHPLCTVGAITETEQRAIKTRPKNLVDNKVRGQLFVNATELVVNLGGGTAVETPRLLVFSGETVLAARMDKENGRVLLSANIHDKTGQIIARLEDNEWSMAPDNVWDFEVFPLHAKVRQGQRDVAFAVDVRNDQIDLRGKWFHKGQNIEFTPNEARIGTNRLIGFNVSHCGAMIAVG
jgi:hypothetical protein